eukprot:scaffold80423_cov14-Tisochrysis_lutea.AAC.1
MSLGGESGMARKLSVQGRHASGTSQASEPCLSSLFCSYKDALLVCAFYEVMSCSGSANASQKPLCSLFTDYCHHHPSRM